MPASKILEVPNSPIEFVVVGPDGGRDRVLVRSAGAGFELIGLAAQNSDRSLHPLSGRRGLGILTIEPPTNVISSQPLEDTRPEIDARKSRYRFAWKGFASEYFVGKVREEFMLILPNIRDAVRSGEREDVEWALAPLLLHCVESHNARLRSRQQMRFWLLLYMLTGLAMMLFYLIFG